MSDYSLAKWRHPQSMQKRVYINNDDLDDADLKVFVFPTGTMVTVRWAGTGKPDDLPSWYAEEAAAKGISVEAYIYRMALEDAGLPLTASFDQVWSAAD